MEIPVSVLRDITIDTGVDMTLFKDDFLDFMRVVEMGAAKYDADGWLEPDGAKTSHKDMHASMFRHLACSSSGIREDDESGLDHLLHLATRALMMYTRHKRGIRHPDDYTGVKHV